CAWSAWRSRAAAPGRRRPGRLVRSRPSMTRSQAMGLSRWTPDEVSAPAPHRFYRAVATETFVIDGFDQRIPVEISYVFVLIGSLAHATVDALPQQIRMAAVSGVLLDPVHQQLPDGDGVLPQTHAQIRMLGQYRVGGCLLTGQVGICGVDRRRFGDRSVEVGVARAVQLRWGVAGQDPAAPVPLYLGEGPEQAE